MVNNLNPCNVIIFISNIIHFIWKHYVPLVIWNIAFIFIRKIAYNLVRQFASLVKC